MKRNKLQYTELRSLDSAIEQLQELLDGLRAGVLRLGRGEQQLLLKPGAVLDFALSAEREGEQERFQLSLEWRRQELGIASGPAAAGEAPKFHSMPVPAGRGLALQAEAERLFDEDEAEAPLSSDDDYTVAPDDVDAPLQAEASDSPAPALAAAREEVDQEAVTVRHSSPPAGQSSVSGVPSDAERFERLYAAARMAHGDGRPRLDEQRFAESLATAGLEPQLQQELCSLARQADAEGRERLFKERSISELIASTLSGAA